MRPHFIYEATPNALVEVLESQYGIGSGVGTLSCTLCHASSAGGPGNINSDFGKDFKNAGGAQNLIDSQLLETLMAIESIDSDGDGLLNGEEYAQCSNPNDQASTTDNCDGLDPPRFWWRRRRWWLRNNNRSPSEWWRAFGSIRAFIPISFSPYCFNTGQSHKKPKLYTLVL